MITDDPRTGGRFLWRALLACLVIIVVTGSGAYAAGILLINDTFDGLRHNGLPRIKLPHTDPPVKAGSPRTFMILGSDLRRGTPGFGKPRSDTILLVRLDKNKKTIGVMSIPRDLRVDVPGPMYGQKINAAFEEGGAELTIQTVESILSTPERPFHVSHVIQVDFRGFRRVVDGVGCVWIDVDHRYFNDISGPGGYATINIEPGYQRLCGYDALDYARFRHTDSDLFRASRQQDVVRQIGIEAGRKGMLTFANRKKLIGLVAKDTVTDDRLLETKQLIAVLKLGLVNAGKPIRQVRWRGEAGPSFVTSTPDQVVQTVNDFFTDPPDQPKAKKASKKPTKKKPATPGDMQDVTAASQALPIGLAKNRLPIYLPTALPPRASYSGPLLQYVTRDEKHALRRAYRAVVDLGKRGEYLGIQGITWRDPPILSGSYDTRVVGNRTLRLYYDGRKLRLVAWRTPTGTYWVSNSLDRAVQNRRLIAVAASLSKMSRKAPK